jgi:chemotaxis protein CheX
MEKYIQPFIDVCVNVFKEFLHLDVITGRPYFSVKEAITEWDISAVIGLTGEARGAVVISLKKENAIKLTDILTGTKHSDFDGEVVDAVGEIINIIAGNAKRGLEDAFKLNISLPTIVKGIEHSVIWSDGKTRVLCIPFQFLETESFCLSVAIEAVGGT